MAETVLGSTCLLQQNQRPEASFHSFLFRVHFWQEIPTPTFKGRLFGGRGGGVAGRSGLPLSLCLLRGHSGPTPMLAAGTCVALYGALSNRSQLDAPLGTAGQRGPTASLVAVLEV